MSKDLDIALKTAEFQHEKEMTTKFSARMQAAVHDAGQVDTFRHTILSYVSQESYDRAIEELEKYVNSKDEFPKFKDRAQRYARYAVDLINAVRAKRSFPGLQHLAMSKQQDLFDRAMEHFDELKLTLKKIEQIDREVKIEDVRSTVLVVQVVVYSLISLALVGFMLEISKGVLPTAYSLIDHSLTQMTDFIFDKLGI